MTAQTRELGTRLKAIRKQKAISGIRLAKLLNYSQAGISKIENGVLAPSEEYLARFCAAMHLPKSEFQELLELLQRSPVETRAVTMPLSQIQDDVATMLERTRVLRSFDLLTVAGLLQTRSYAYQIFCMTGAELSDDTISAIERRFHSRRFLDDPTKRVYVVLYEAALRPVFCLKNVMREQVNALLEQCEYETVDLKIIPFGVQLPKFPVTDFTIYDTRMVSIEHMRGAVCLRNRADVQAYLDAFQALDEVALSGSRMRKLLASIARELR
jgi:transcriptional regulator with XRE-family HTH domain